jgi:hypothetical protein
MFQETTTEIRDLMRSGALWPMGVGENQVSSNQITSNLSLHLDCLIVESGVTIPGKQNASVSRGQASNQNFNRQDWIQSCGKGESRRPITISESEANLTRLWFLDQGFQEPVPFTFHKGFTRQSQLFEVINMVESYTIGEVTEIYQGEELTRYTLSYGGSVVTSRIPRKKIAKV